MKYSPKVQEHLAARHPASPVSILTSAGNHAGMLEIYYQIETILREISGMDAFSLQARAEAHGLFANASIIRAYHRAPGG
jgi:glycine dehydrogenase subunit 2